LKTLYYLSVLFLITACSDNKQILKENKFVNLFYDKAFEFRDNAKTDSAFLYFYKAKDVFLQAGDQFGAAKCFTNLAIIQETKGDYFGSQETATFANKYFNPEDSLQFQYLSINYNSLGIATSKLRNDLKAIEFYQKALNFTNNIQDRIIYQNNLGNCYTRIKNYTKAIEILNNTIKLSDKEDIHFSRTLTNLALAKWLQNPKYNPIPEFRKALKIRLEGKDDWGLNSSYAHIADFYIKSKPDSAIYYANKMLAAAKKIKSADDQAEALQKLIILDPQNYTSHFIRYQFLNDSIQTARNKAKNQFALIRYETEKNKADFLKAKAQSAERQNKIIIRNIALIAAFITIVGFYIYLHKRQKRLQQEKLLEVKNTELKYSKKVHDRVANRIYQIISFIENTLHPDKNSILFALENVYETSRDISYENPDVNEKQNYREQLFNMLDSYSSQDVVKVLIVGNKEEIWQNTNLLQKTEVYLVLQELMTNMKKHSNASIVSIRFQRDDTAINIAYTDNGVGIKDFSPKNGMKNMENRINAINGRIIFDTQTNNLLKINISIPV